MRLPQSKNNTIIDCKILSSPIVNFKTKKHINQLPNSKQIKKNKIF